MVKEIKLQTTTFEALDPFSFDGTFETQVESTIPVKFRALDDQNTNIQFAIANLEVYNSAGVLIDTLPFVLEASEDYYHSSWNSPPQAGDYFLKILVAHENNPPPVTHLFDENNLHCFPSTKLCEITVDPQSGEAFLPEGLVSLKVTLTQKDGVTKYQQE